METSKPGPFPYRYIYALMTVVFLFGVVLLGVDLFCFSENFYRKEFRKLGTAAYIGTDEQTVNDVTKVLLDYLKGKRDDIDITARVNDIETEFYNDREKAHMVDVRQLYRTARTVGYTGIVGLLFFMTLSFVIKNRQVRLEALKGYVAGNVVFFSMIVLLSIWVLIDFNSFWVSFHRLFFTNDLWLLNPYTDRMINVFEEQLFFDLVIRIAIFSIVVMATILIAVIAYKKDISNRREQEIE